MFKKMCAKMRKVNNVNNFWNHGTPFGEPKKVQFLTFSLFRAFFVKKTLETVEMLKMLIPFGECLKKMCAKLRKC